ncbi:hypothetical protein QOT17_017316 [Balamuthia mandrillaris]
MSYPLYVGLAIGIVGVGLYYAFTWQPIDGEMSFIVPAPREKVYAMFSDVSVMKKFFKSVNRIEEHWDEKGVYSFTVWEDVPFLFNTTLASSIKFIPTKVENESIHIQVITNKVFQLLARSEMTFVFEDVPEQAGATKIREQITGEVARCIKSMVMENWKEDHGEVHQKIMDEFEQRREQK